jgi:hypothetical protein
VAQDEGRSKRRVEKIMIFKKKESKKDSRLEKLQKLKDNLHG